MGGETQQVDVVVDQTRDKRPASPVEVARRSAESRADRGDAALFDEDVETHAALDLDIADHQGFGHVARSSPR